MLTSDLFENKTPAAWRAGYERGLRYYRQGPDNPYPAGSEEAKDYADGYHNGELDSYDKYDTSTMNEGAVKELSQDLRSMSDEEFLARYKMTKAQARAGMKSGVAEDSLNEFAPGAGGDDDIGDDPYKYPKPKRYNRSADYFEQFEADHFDREDFDDDTGVFKGYWGNTQIAYFKFDNPARTGGNNPGMGWYYEPESASRSDDTAAPAADDSAQRKQQELDMIRAFLKSGNRPNPDSQIGRLMKRYGMSEGQVNELSSELLNRAAQAAKNKSDRAMDPTIHDALGGGYTNPLAKHYGSLSQKFSNKAVKIGQRDAVKTIASPATMRKIGMAEGDKMSRINLDQSLASTPPMWKKFISSLPPQLAREFVDERPRPDQDDIDFLTPLRLISPQPVSVRVADLLRHLENQGTIGRSPDNVVAAVNKQWGLKIPSGKKYDPNPARYQAYAQMAPSTASPSVMADGVILFGAGRFVAAALRGDETMRVWSMTRKQAVAEGSLEEIDRRGFLKGAGAALGATALGTPTDVVAKTWSGKLLVPNILEKNVQYYITNLSKQGNVLIVGITRIGPSGKSTTVRAIDCKNALWKYLEDDGYPVTNMKWSSAVPGSSADRIMTSACATQDRILKEPKKQEVKKDETGSANTPSVEPSAGYAGRIRARIIPNIIFTDEEVKGNPKAEVEVRAKNDGTIINRRLLSSSGNAAWDEAVLRAIDRTVILPIDVDGRVPPVLHISFRPKDTNESFQQGVDEQQLTEQDLAEAVSTLELADFLFKGLEQKFPKIIERYGHEVVGNAIMDVAEENLDVSSVSEVDMLIDDIIEKLQNYNGNDSGLTESTVSRLYYHVVGTSAPELRKNFGMRHDRQGWFLSESSGRNRIMDAQRAFGNPKLVEYSVSDATGGAATLGPDRVISPVGSVSKSQRTNTKKQKSNTL